MVEKSELTAGLKQAVEKGYSLELAKKSFILAGYNEQDVEDSAKSIMGYTSGLPAMMSTQQNPQPMMPTSKSPQTIPQLPSMSNTYLHAKPAKSSKMTIIVILLAIILVMLLATLGASIFYKQQLIDLLKNVGINLG